MWRESFSFSKSSRLDRSELGTETKVISPKNAPQLKNIEIQEIFDNSYFYIEKWTFKIMCEVCYRAKRDKKEAT